MAQSDDRVLMAIRARVRRKIHTIFAALAFATLALAVVTHITPGFAGLGLETQGAVADAFLFLGVANALTMHVWDYLFWNDLNA